MLSKYIVLSALAAIASAADVPYWCAVDKTDAANSYRWDDQSDICQANGIGTHCCSTFIEDGAGDCPTFAEDVGDLENALAQQITKEGQWKSSQFGKWLVSFQLLTTAVTNRGVESPWFKGIEDFQASNPKTRVGNIFFNLDGNQLVATHVC